MSSSSDPNSRINEVKAIVTLRSDKELTQLAPKTIDPGQEAIETELEEVVIKQTVEKNKASPPFPQALKVKKKAINQVDMIKQVPTYAKFLKNLCTMKRGLNSTRKPS